MPLWVILTRLCVRQRPNAAEVVAVVLGFTGLVVLLRPGSGSVALGWAAVVLLAAMVEADR